MLLRTTEIQNLFKDYSEGRKIKKQPRFWYFYLVFITHYCSMFEVKSKVNNVVYDINMKNWRLLGGGEGHMIL
jgi:hypothetical protein